MRPPSMPEGDPGESLGKCPGCKTLVYAADSQTTDGNRQWHSLCAWEVLNKVPSQRGKRQRPGQLTLPLPLTGGPADVL